MSWPSSNPFHPESHWAHIPKEPVVRTPEENQRLAEERPRSVSVTVNTLEDWIRTLEDIEGDSAADVLPDLLLDMRSHLPG